ncbi:MAG: site-specific integrase [Gammaproteobacteria bacterium]|nr:site-specific integrase [Gammaproteobacteria bacterium]
MKITLHERKLKSGKTSLSLQYYNGYTKDDKGKIKHNRSFEPLDIIIHSNPKTTREKTDNRQNREIAEKILSIRKTEQHSLKHDLIDPNKSKACFLAFFSSYVDKKGRETSRSNHSVWLGSQKHLEAYFATLGQTTIKFKSLNKEHVEGFRGYLLNQALTKSDKKLSVNTASSYFNRFMTVLKDALELGYTGKGITDGVKRVKGETPKREYLTEEELISLSKIECRFDVLRRAFLFSCLTGLRWSDCHNLCWQDIEFIDGSPRVIFRQIKTKKQEYLDISNTAYKLMGTPGESKQRVFSGLRYSSYMNVELSKWVMRAGITKDITFHSGRHTFATLALTKGTDLYVVKELLGHEDIKTTQIYAKIIDEKKKKAMETMPVLEI